MSELIRPIVETFRFNSGLVALGLEDLRQEDAVGRWKDGDGSSILYLTGHISSSRVGILKALGAGKENPYKELFGAGVGARDGTAYPPLSSLARGWKETADELHAAPESITDEAVLRPSDASFPTADQTLRGQLAFIAWHESYHVGQIGLMRSEMGYSSLRQRLISARPPADS